MNYDDVFARHKNAALQLSGGKDSLAVLYYLKAYWDKFTVYWLNSGDTFPELLEFMSRIRKEVPRFVEVQGRQPQVIEQLGWPTDVVPTSASPFGRLASGKPLKLNDRYFCCFKSIMEPLHERMVSDGITLMIRGQKNSDAVKGPYRSGDKLGNMEFLYPLEHLTDEEILQYLKDNNIPIPRFYDKELGITNAPDCMSCTAWLEHNHPAYLKKYHPEQYKKVQKRLNTIAIAVEPYVNRLKEFKD